MDEDRIAFYERRTPVGAEHGGRVGGETQRLPRLHKVCSLSCLHVYQRQASKRYDRPGCPLCCYMPRKLYAQSSQTGVLSGPIVSIEAS